MFDIIIVIAIIINEICDFSVSLFVVNLYQDKNVVLVCPAQNQSLTPWQ